MRRLLFIILLTLPTCCWAQSPFAEPSRWRSYLSHAAGRGVVLQGDMAYKLSEAGLALLELDPLQYRELSPLEGLASAQPTAIFYAPAADRVILGHADGSLDLLYEGRVERQLFDIRRATAFTNRAIRAFAERGDSLFVATDFGIVLYALSSAQVLNTTAQLASLPPQTAVTSLALHNDSLYALAGGQLWRIALTQDLAVPSNWQPVANPTGTPLGLAANSNMLYTFTTDSLYALQGGTWQAQSLPESGSIRSIQAFEAGVVVVRGGFVLRLLEGQPTQAYPANDPRFAFYQPSTARLALADELDGLAIEQLGTGNARSRLAARQSPVPSNSVAQLTTGGGFVHVATGGFVAGFQPAFNAAGYWRHQPLLGTYSTFSLPAGSLDSSLYLDLTALAYDPATGTAHVGSFGQGVLSVPIDGAPQADDGTTSGLPGQLRDPLTGIPELFYIGGLTVDDGGTLWATSFEADTALAARLPSGTWQALPTGPFGQLLALTTGPEGYTWVRLASGGVLVYDPGTGLSNLASHRFRRLSSLPNNGALPSENVLSLLIDSFGELWIGTDAGPAVLRSPQEAFATNVPPAEQLLTTQGVLLNNVPVQAMAEDAASRKWLGTPQGLFLVSDDGTAILAALDSRNSPLLSDDITALAFEPASGLLFIATPLGLQALQTDASQPLDDAPALTIQPNPVYSDFTGPVFISGTPAGATVRVLTLDGRRVAELSSTAGRATWTFAQRQQQRLASGVYIVVATAPDGRPAATTKLAFIRR